VPSGTPLCFHHLSLLPKGEEKQFKLSVSEEDLKESQDLNWSIVTENKLLHRLLNGEYQKLLKNPLK
jgi:hypothetical protein